MESGVYLNPNNLHIEQIRAKKRLQKQQRQEKEQLLSRVSILEERLCRLEEIIINLSSKNL